MISQPEISPFQPLFTYLEQFHPISDEYRNTYNGHAQLIKVRKNKYILSPLDHNACLYFLNSGIVRGFIKEGAKDITTWFSFGNEIIGAIRHPHENAYHSIEYLQALEDCTLICIPYTLIDILYSTFAECDLIGRKILAIQYHAASERSILARIPIAADRYKRLMASGIQEFSRVPLRYLASYLGMRLETLSRIRSKKLTTHYQDNGLHQLDTAV